MTDSDGDGIYEHKMDLPPGRYLYKFVVNGTWYEDPNAAAFEDDNHGGKNSILTISEDGVVSPAKDYCPQFLLESYEFVLCGPLYQVVPRK